MSETPAYCRREQWGWYFYDWANSAFYTSVVTVFLGPYLTSVAKAAAVGGRIYPLGIAVAPQSLWPYLVSLSVLSQVIVMPLVGAIADYGRRKRELLGCLAFTGAGATFAMFWLDGGRWAFGASMFLLANLAFGAAIVLYNSFLPEIAPAESRDAVSSNGWGFGYLGGGLLLALHLLLFSKADEWGLGGSLAVRVALSTSGIWWATFTVITLATLRNRGARKSPPPGQSLVGAGVRQLAITLREVVKLPQTLLFLAAYLIYNDAIQTVIAMASQFGSEELHLDLGVLSAAILLTQFVAFGGALAFNQLAARIGNKQAVMVALVIWSATLVYAYAGVRTKTEFYAMAAVVGIVLGGSQALSRSIFSFMIPKGHEAEYYSVYEISDKGTSWLGPLFFGLALQWTGSFRVAIVSLIVFFIAGLLLLARVDVVRAAQEAGNKPPPRG